MLLKHTPKGILKFFAGFLLATSFCGTFFGGFVARAHAFFDHDLKIGDSGEDVRELQRVLNTNSATVVANDGPGSGGNETSYFGSLTKFAVISFQELYRSEILTPNGLSSGTGFVGPATRAKLNAIASGGGPIQSTSDSSISVPANAIPSSLVAPPTSSVSPSAFLQSLFPQKISLLNVSKYQVAPGGVILISGSGFANGENYLHIGENHTVLISVSTSPSSVPGVTLMQATVPSDLASGKYEIWVTKGQNGVGVDSSRNPSVPFSIFVTSTPHDSPEISTISPSPADASGQIVISGTGFTAGGNNIYSTLGNISNVSVSPDGTLTVRISDFPGAAQIKKSPGTQSFIADGWLYVQNENGVNNTPAAFKVKF